MSSRLNIDSSTRMGALPVRTANDADGNLVVAHAMMVEVDGQARPVSVQDRLPVTGGAGTVHDASGAIGVGSVRVLAGGTRQLLDIQNVGVTVLGINFNGGASLGPGSILLQPGGSLRYAAPSFIPTDEIYAIAAAPGGFLTLKWA